MYDYSMPRKVETPPKVKAPPSSVRELYHLFLKEKGNEGVSPAAFKGYESHIVPWIDALEAAGITRPDEITHEFAVAYLDEYRQRPAQTKGRNGETRTLAPATIRLRRVHICTFEHWMFENGYTSVEPMRHTKPAKGKSQKKAPTPLADLDKVLGIAAGLAAPRDCSFLLCALDTGARPSELLRLDISDFDLPNGKVTFRAEGTKSRVERVGFMTEATVAVLGWYWDKFKMSKHAFGNVYRDERWTYTALRTQLITLSEQAGLGHRLEAHSIRRAFATWMATRVPMHAVAMLLGHSLEGALGITARYVSLGEAELKAMHAANSPVPSLEWVKDLTRWPDGTLIPPIKWSLKVGP